MCIRDSNNENRIRQHLERTYDDVLQCQENGNVLIHCYMGASRSASVVIYYLMRRHGYTFDDALEFLRNKRSVVNPTFRLTKDLAESIMQR